MARQLEQVFQLVDGLSEVGHYPVVRVLRTGRQKGSNALAVLSCSELLLFWNGADGVDKRLGQSSG